VNHSRTATSLFFHHFLFTYFIYYIIYTLRKIWS